MSNVHIAMERRKKKKDAEVGKKKKEEIVLVPNLRIKDRNVPYGVFHLGPKTFNPSYLLATENKY